MTQKKPAPVVKHAAVIAITFCACFLAYQIGHIAAVRRTAAYDKPQLGLQISPENLSFGTVWEQERFQWTVPIHNESDRAISIEEIDSSCNCTQIEPRSMTIPAHESQALQLTIDLTPHADQRMLFERDVALYLSARAMPTTLKSPGWVLRGKVRSAIRPVAAPSLGEHSEKTQAVPELRLAIQALLPLKGLSATCNDNRFAVQISPLTKNPNTFELRATPIVKLPKGPFICNVVLAAEPSGTLPIPPFTLPLQGRILADVQPSSPVVLLGADYVGNRLRETITLASLTDSDFVVERCNAVQPGAKIVPVPNYPKSFDLVLPCAAAGQQTSTVTFDIRYDGNNKTSLSLPVQYHGFASEDARK